MPMRKFFTLLFGFSLLSFFILLLFFKENYLYSGSMHLGMFSIAMFFLWKKDWKTTLNSIGIPGDLKTNVIYSIGGFFALIGMLTALFIIVSLLGIENDSHEVGEIIRSLPFYLPLLAIIIAPITEELLFRALLVPRVGVLVSSALFAVSHITYGSTMEIAGAFIVGILFALIYKGSRSVLPCMAVHFCYNLLSVLAIFMVAA